MVSVDMLLLFLDGAVTNDPGKMFSCYSGKCVDVVGLEFGWGSFHISDCDKFRNVCFADSGAIVIPLYWRSRSVLLNLFANVSMDVDGDLKLL